MAAGVDFGTRQARLAQRMAGFADGLDLGVGGRVLGAVDLVDRARQHLALVHQHGAEGPATGADVGPGQVEGFTHELFCGHE